MKTINKQLTVLVAGASGATGRHLVDQLLKAGHLVKAIVRTPENLPEILQYRPGLTVIQASILDLTEEQIAMHLSGCDAIASCLGHRITMKGIWGKPRRLVTDSVKLLSEASKRSNGKKPIKFVLMNTTGNRNKDLNEKVTIGQRIVVAILRLILPPHPDNEQAAEYLRVQIGQDHKQIEWVAIRPDTLIDLDEVTSYDIHQSPIRDAIFNSGKTSRINVGHFMAQLIHDQELWDKWKGQMPVIYNRESEES